MSATEVLISTWLKQVQPATPPSSISATEVRISTWLTQIQPGTPASSIFGSDRGRTLNEGPSVNGPELARPGEGAMVVAARRTGSSNDHKENKFHFLDSTPGYTQFEIPNHGEGYMKDSIPVVAPRQGCVQDDECTKLMARLGCSSTGQTTKHVPSPAFPIFPTHHFDTNKVQPSRSPHSVFTTASTYFTLSHERLSPARVGPALADQPYEIWCACASCRQHRQVIRDLEKGKKSSPMVGFVGYPVMEAVDQVPIICQCRTCAYHLLLIDQLAEKVAIGAMMEKEHWINVSFEEVVVSDWQDILGKKEQAYWRYKTLSDLAIRNHPTIFSLENILRVAECMEAIAYLPSCLTRQVHGEPLSFDEILNKVFFKVAYSIHDEVCRTLDGKPTYAKWHCFFLLVDTFEIYAKTFPVATRTDNIAIMAALYGALRSIVPLECLDDHAFQGLKFDDSHQKWITTRPVTLPSSIPLNHARRYSAGRICQPSHIPSGSLIVPDI